MTSLPKRITDHDLWRMHDPPGAVTVGRPALWDQVGEVNPYTRKVNRCRHCGGITYAAEGDHARYVVSGGRHVLTDCTGRVISITDGT